MLYKYQNRVEVSIAIFCLGKVRQISQKCKSILENACTAVALILWLNCNIFASKGYVNQIYVENNLAFKPQLLPSKVYSVKKHYESKLGSPTTITKMRPNYNSLLTWFDHTTYYSEILARYHYCMCFHSSTIIQQSASYNFQISQHQVLSFT